MCWAGLNWSGSRRIRNGRRTSEPFRSETGQQTHSIAMEGKSSCFTLLVPSKKKEGASLNVISLRPPIGFLRKPSGHHRSPTLDLLRVPKFKFFFSSNPIFSPISLRSDECPLSRRLAFGSDVKRFMAIKLVPSMATLCNGWTLWKRRKVST